MSNPSLSGAPAAWLRQRLAQGTPTFLMALRAWATPEAVHFAASTGHHGLYVDLQHGAISCAEATTLCLVARAMALPALVRIPAIDAALIGNLLDNGAAGILVPDIEDAMACGQLVQAAKYPPLGRRSHGGRRGFALESVPFLAVMVESELGVRAAGAIASVPGLDALVVGMVDLAASLRAAPDSAQTLAAAIQIIAAGQSAGVPVIVAGLRDAGNCRAMVAHGAAACCITGTDIAYLFDGAARKINEFQSAFDVRRCSFSPPVAETHVAALSSLPSSESAT